MIMPNDNTPASIIGDAYFDAGLIQEGQSPNSEQLVTGMRKLRELINFIQVDAGLRLWLNADTELPLVAGQAIYNFSPAGDVVMVKPLRVIDAYYLDVNDVSRPLVSLSRKEYDQLGNKTTQGAVNSYFVDKQATALIISLYNVPDTQAATGTVHVLLQTQVTNFSTLTETMNFPIEWRMALHWGLADALATGQPQTIMDRCQQRALYYRDKLGEWDVEDADTRFAPDSRGNRFTGMFN